jgi:hypothetical protein
MIRSFLEQVDVTGPTPKAIIAPHAGYRYSGPIAASAYARLQGTSFQRVLLLGPSHTVHLQGIAASSAEAFATPLGNVLVDTAVVQTSLRLPQVRMMDEAHLREHGLEVHLPFLQMVCRDFALVPLVVGAVETADLAHLLAALYTSESLIVVSSDLSHYYDYGSWMPPHHELLNRADQKQWNMLAAVYPFVACCNLPKGMAGKPKP